MSRGETGTSAGSRWLQRVPGAARRHRRLVLVVVLLLTALSATALPGLRLQSSIYELFPRRPGPIADLADYGTLFGASREVVLLVSGQDPGVVARATRRVAAELSRSPSFVDVRAGVESLALVGALGRSLLLLADEQVWPRVARRLTGPLAPEVARLRRLLLSPLAPGREALARDPLGLSELIFEGLESDVDRGTGLFASPDGRAALVFARPAPGAEGAIPAELARIGADVGAREGARLQATGAPIYAHDVARAMRRDLTLSSSVALGGVVLLLLWFFRSFRLLPLAALIGGLAVCWTLALLSVTGARLNMLSLAFAALCIGMGLDGLIHISARTREVTTGDERVLRATQQLMPALLAASLTTVAAFLSFSLSAFEGLSMTGLLAACGLGLTLVLTLALAPSLAAPVPPLQGPTVLDRVLAGLAALPRVPVALVAVASGVGAAVAAAGLPFSADLTRLAPPDLPPVQTDAAIARHFERQRHRLIVLARGADQERVLQVNDALARRLSAMRREGTVASYRSLAGLLPSQATQRARRARLLALEPPRIARRLGQALDEAGLRSEAFQPFIEALTEPRPLTLEKLPAALRPLVQRQLGRQQGQWVIATLVYPRGGAGLAGVERLARETSRPGVSVGLTGAGLAGAQMARLLRTDLLLICLLSLAAVLLAVSLLLRRAWPVVATVLSLLWTGVTFAGALRLLGYEIDLYDLMVLPVLIGYGVDDHIYVARRAMAGGAAEAVRRSGRAVTITTLTSMVAFGALLLCDLPGLRGLGTTAVLGLGLGLVGSLVVMPALLPRRG